MASRSTRTKPTAPEPEDTETGDEGVRVTGLHETHAAYIEDNFGVKVDPLAVALIYKSRVAFRKSDEYEAYLTAKDEEKAAEEATREEEKAARAKAKADAAAAKETEDGDAEDAPVKPKRGARKATASTEDAPATPAPRRGRAPRAAASTDETPATRPARARRGPRAAAAEPAF